MENQIKKRPRVKTVEAKLIASTTAGKVKDDYNKKDHVNQEHKNNH